MNIITLVGRPGKEPEAKLTPNGNKVVNLSLGVDRRGKDNKKETDWIDCQAWGKTADFVEGYVKKGERVGIIGSLQTRTWEAQDGSNRKAYFVVIDKVELMENKKTESAAPTVQAEKPVQAEAPTNQAEEHYDLPFEI